MKTIKARTQAKIQGKSTKTKPRDTKIIKTNTKIQINA